MATAVLAWIQNRARHWAAAEVYMRCARKWLATVQILTGRLLGRLPGSSLRFGPPRRWTADARTWALADEAAEIVDLDRAYREDRAVPSGQGAFPRQFRHAATWHMPATYVLTVTGGRIWGEFGTPITADDVVLTEMANRFDARPETSPVLCRLSLGEPTHLPGTVASIAGAYSDSYYHWMFDLLPRVGLLERAGSIVDWYIVPELTRTTRECLDRAGVDLDRCIPARRDSYFSCDKLVLPSLPGISGMSPRPSTDYLRGLFADVIAISKPARRIYVTRQGTGRREIANSDEVENVLARYGFETVRLDGLSVAEQARTFADAELVVAPHGGALTNVVFCAKGSVVIEMFGAGYHPHCYWTICDNLGVRYRALFNAVDVDAGRQWANIDVDIAALERALEWAVRSARS